MNTTKRLGHLPLLPTRYLASGISGLLRRSCGSVAWFYKLLRLWLRHTRLSESLLIDYSFEKSRWNFIIKIQIIPKSQKYFQATGQLPTVSYMLAFSLKLIIQIVFQTIFLFMILWMTLFHKRWENFRYFMIRNYSAESVIYLSGFLILFAFTVTTLGEGLLSLLIRLE